MGGLEDKLILFLLLLSINFPFIDTFYMILPILMVIIISALLSYFEHPNILKGFIVLYFFLCFLSPCYLFFLPLIGYDASFTKAKYTFLILLLPLMTSTYIPTLNKWEMVFFTFLTFLLKNRTKKLEILEKDYRDLRDTTKEISLKLETQNKMLIAQQDNAINFAKLKERNRIARDIHDNVGHLLSRTLLQLGALLVTIKDDSIKKDLLIIKKSLAEAMDSIRHSVHNLYENSINLQEELQKLVKNFKFCSIGLEYTLEGEPDKSIKNCFIAVTKEALSNIIKHSNATEVNIHVKDHPALYQLIIEDNGTKSSKIPSEGLGIKNMHDRVSSLNGNIHINADNGFRIFISIPK